MVTFNLDPAEGVHMASDLSDEELELLQHVLTVEFAIRLEGEDYQRLFQRIAEHRPEMEEMVSDWRRQRDTMRFVDSVTADLRNLPILEEKR